MNSSAENRGILYAVSRSCILTMNDRLFVSTEYSRMLLKLAEGSRWKVQAEPNSDLEMSCSHSLDCNLAEQPGHHVMAVVMTYLHVMHSSRTPYLSFSDGGSFNGRHQPPDINQIESGHQWHAQNRCHGMWIRCHSIHSPPRNITTDER